MMKSMLIVCLPLLLAGAEIDGTWNLHLVRFGEEFAAARVELKSDGSKVTGTLNELKLEGTFAGGQLKITATRPDGKEWGQFEAKLDGDNLSGSVKQNSDEFNWKARRDTSKTTAPKTHTFEPTA